jgi:hypothetical protein
LLISTDQITETAGFPDVGVTRIEIVPYPNTIDTVEQLAPAIAALVSRRTT